MKNQRRITHVFVIDMAPSDALISDLEYKYPQSKIRVVSNFDFRNLSLTELSQYCDVERFTERYNRPLVPGEIGCAAAHKYCYQMFTSEDGDLAIILEDDAIVEFNTLDLIEYCTSAGLNFDLLNLKITGGLYSAKPTLKTDFGEIYRCRSYQYCTHAYIINQSQSLRFLRNQSPRISFIADWPVQSSFEFACSRIYGLDTEKFNFKSRPTTIWSNPPEYYRWKFRVGAYLDRLNVVARENIFGDREATTDINGRLHWVSRR